MAGQPQQAPNQNIGSTLKVAVNEMMVCVGDVKGRLIGISRRTGQILWRLTSSFNPLQRLSMDQDVIVLTGRGGPAHRVPRPSAGGLMVLHAMTGESLFPQLVERKPVRWAGLGHEGLVFYVTSDALVAHDLSSGAMEWRLKLQDLSFQNNGWISDELLLLELEQFSGAILAVDPGTGSPVHRLTSLFPDQRRHLKVERVEDRWHLTTPLQSMTLRSDGRTQWRDAIQRNDKESRLLQLITEPFVVVLSQVQGNLEGFSYAMYLLDRRTGILRRDIKIGPLPQPIDEHRCAVLTDCVLLSFGSSTLVLPGATANHGLESN